MQDVHINKLPLRALKIIRKGYRKNRINPVDREKLKIINKMILEKERIFTEPNPLSLKTNRQKNGKNRYVTFQRKV